MNIKLSFHARFQHRADRWNPKTILQAYNRGHLGGVTVIEGKTSDVLFGFTRTGECVGLVMSKPKKGVHVVVTGYAASKDYWLSF